MLKKSEVITKLGWWNLYHIIWDMRQNAQRLTCTSNILVIITSKKIGEVKKRTKLNVWPIPMISYTTQSNNCVPVIFDFNWLPCFIKLYTQSNNHDISIISQLNKLFMSVIFAFVAKQKTAIIYCRCVFSLLFLDM